MKHLKLCEARLIRLLTRSTTKSQAHHVRSYANVLHQVPLPVPNPRAGQFWVLLPRLTLRSHLLESYRRR